MTENQETSQSKKHVKRKRKRLYEPISDSPEIIPESVSLVPSKKGSKASSANEIIADYVLLSAGTALLPVPLIDMIAVAAVELRMLKRLSDLYEIKFSEQRGKALIASLLGGFHAGLFTGSLVKLIPVLGFVGAMIPIAVLAGALTYAVGKVFVQHFEMGGTLLDFDSQKMRAFFEKKYREGQDVVSELRKRGK